MNQLLAALDFSAWKPMLTALLLPPVPFLLLVLVGARLILPRRGVGWTMVVVGVVGVWFSSCLGVGVWMEHRLLHEPPPWTAERMATLKSAQAQSSDAAIVVLGSGRERLAPEYGVSSLTEASLQRLRYGVWLSRRTGVPLAFSGGTGWGQTEGASEAEIAGRIAAEEFAHPLRWMETESRDTRENAMRSVALLKAAHVRRIVLVTDGWHARRALRNFERAAADSGLQIDVAPMGLATALLSSTLDWLPSSVGYERVRLVLRETIGWWAGA